MATLPELGKAPNFTGIVSWFNTPGDKPLTLAQLKGKVVLVDFWTYSCINCQRSLPHVEGWYKDYKKDGLVVVGVSTPEFAFEHVISNVRSAAGNLGIDYPIAIDNNYGTWDAYNNEYWPAEYLIDPTGEVRAYDFGEGGYSTMESNIRALLTANGVTTLPPRTDVPNKTPTDADHPGELRRLRGGAVRRRDDDRAQQGRSSTTRRSTVPLNSFAFNGTWTDHSQEATAGADASIDLHFVANDVYLVMGGTGTVDVSFNGRHLTTVNVSGVPRLYTLFSGNALQTGQLDLTLLSRRAGLRLHLRLRPPGGLGATPEPTGQSPFAPATAAARSVPPRSPPISERCRSGRRPLALRNYRDFSQAVIEANRPFSDPRL